jgi:hypothetical protein
MSASTVKASPVDRRNGPKVTICVQTLNNVSSPSDTAFIASIISLQRVHFPLPSAPSSMTRNYGGWIRRSAARFLRHHK